MSITCLNTGLNMCYHFSMARRSLDDRNIRKLIRNQRSLLVTLPIEFVRELKWRERQRVTVTKRGKELVIKDYDPKDK